MKAFANRRRQNKCNLNVEICFEKYRKDCWKRRKCWFPAFSPIPKMFSKAFFLRVVKSVMTNNTKGGNKYMLFYFLTFFQGSQTTNSALAKAPSTAARTTVAMTTVLSTGSPVTKPPSKSP